MKKPFETTITRRTKQEAQTAIDDLLKRGFYISYPLTELNRGKESKGKYDYQKGRFSFNSFGVYSCWTAKMRKED